MRRRKRDYPGRAYRKLQRKKREYAPEIEVAEAATGLIIVLIFILYGWATGGLP